METALQPFVESCMQYIAVMSQQSASPPITEIRELLRELVVVAVSLLREEQNSAIGAMYRANLMISNALADLSPRIGDLYPIITLTYSHVIEAIVLQAALGPSNSQILQAASELDQHERTTSLLANALIVLARGEYMALIQSVLSFASLTLDENTVRFALDTLDNPAFSESVRDTARQIRSILG
jgi:hypothetical protein